MVFESHQCYEVYLIAKSDAPDLHVRIIGETDNDYLVECLWRKSNSYEKIGSRNACGSIGITKESTMNTDSVIAQLNEDYCKYSSHAHSMQDIIVDKGIKWYVFKSVFQNYYLPCKTHKKNIYLKLEEMLSNEI